MSSYMSYRLITSELYYHKCRFYVILSIPSSFGTLSIQEVLIILTEAPHFKNFQSKFFHCIEPFDYRVTDMVDIPSRLLRL